MEKISHDREETIIQSRTSWDQTSLSHMRSGSVFVPKHSVPYNFKRFASRVPSQIRALRVNDLSTDPVSEEGSKFKLKNTT